MGDMDHLKTHIRKEHDIVKYKVDLVVALSFMDTMEEKSLIKGVEWRIKRIQETGEMTCALCRDQIECKVGDIDQVKIHMRNEHDIVKYKLDLVLALGCLNTAGEKKIIEGLKERIELFINTGEIIINKSIFGSIKLEKDINVGQAMCLDNLSNKKEEDAETEVKASLDAMDVLRRVESSLLVKCEQEEGECTRTNEVEIGATENDNLNQIVNDEKTNDAIKGLKVQNDIGKCKRKKKKVLNKKSEVSSKILKVKDVSNENERKPMGRPTAAQDRLCLECGKVFPRNSGKNASAVFKKHMLKHVVENFSCECPDLPKVYTRPDQVRSGQDFMLKERHLKMVHLGWNGCEECKECFESPAQLSEHVERHKVVFVCDQCGFVARDKEKLKHHHKTRHESSPMLCTEQNCGKILNNKFALDKHIRRVHISSACHICGVVLKNISVHMQEQHMSNADKKLHCEDCGKGFMDKQRLTGHRMNMHIKTQPYRCRFGCTNRYNSQSNRNAHERRRHGGVPSKMAGSDT